MVRLRFHVVAGIGLVSFLWSFGASSAALGKTPWVSLFDGRTLAGWSNPYDWGRAWVEDGQLCLQGDRKFFLVTEKTYDDFIFEGEVMIPEGESNSGFMFRCHQGPNRVFGYQAEVDPSARQWSGGLYDEGRRGWLNPGAGDPNAALRFVEATQGAFKPGQWNRYRIHCVGPSIRIYLNDVLTTDVIDTTDRGGYIGVQHHGEAGQVYRFRKLRIRELKAPKALTETRNGMPLVFFEDFESGAGRWAQTDPNAWKIIDVNDNHVFSQFQASEYEPPVYSPYNITWTKDFEVGSFVLQARLEQTGREYGHRDMCIFFGYQDPSHYYYAHIATAADDAAHMIHIVNGSPRTSIIRQRTKGVDWGTGFHDVRLVRDTDTGSIDVYFDDMETPVLQAADKTFKTGAIGFGTFDDTGNVDDIMVWGVTK